MNRLNATLPFWTHLWVLTLPYLASQSYCPGANESRTVFCGLVRSFSAGSQLTKRHANTTRFWRQKGIYAPPLNIPSVCPGPSSLAGLKAMQAGRSRPPPPPSFTPRALQDITVRLKANNVPTAHVHILCGSAAFPQSLAILQSGKGVSYMRAGSLLCVAVIHLRPHEQFDS